VEVRLVEEGEGKELMLEEEVDGRSGDRDGRRGIWIFGGFGRG
jgi:hypothetical protein